MPSQREYKDLSNAPSEKPGKSWADFADNFLFQFFEGQSFSVWIFVTGLLIVIYEKYSTFEDNYYGNLLKNTSLILLLALSFLTLIKNVIFINFFGLGYKIRKILKTNQTYKQKRWLADVADIEFKKLNLPIKVINFRKITTKVRILDSGDGRWRAGFIFENADNTREYIFHAYQDKDSQQFKSRIVERTAAREVADKNKIIGINNPHYFELLAERGNKEINFYIDGVFVNGYQIPEKNLDSIIIAAWSDRGPIKVLFEEIHVDA